MKMKQSSSLDSSHYSSSRSQRGAAMATTPSSLYTGRRTEASTGDMLRRAFAPRAKAWIYGVKPSGRLGDRDASDMRNFVSLPTIPQVAHPPPRPWSVVAKHQVILVNFPHVSTPGPKVPPDHRVSANFWHCAVASHGGGCSDLNPLNLGYGFVANRAKDTEALMVLAIFDVGVPLLPVLDLSFGHSRRIVDKCPPHHPNLRKQIRPILTKGLTVLRNGPHRKVLDPFTQRERQGHHTPRISRVDPR